MKIERICCWTTTWKQRFSSLRSNFDPERFIHGKFQHLLTVIVGFVWVCKNLLELRDIDSLGAVELPTFPQLIYRTILMYFCNVNLIFFWKSFVLCVWKVFIFNLLTIENILPALETARIRPLSLRQVVTYSFIFSIKLKSYTTQLACFVVNISNNKNICHKESLLVIIYAIIHYDCSFCVCKRVSLTQTIRTNKMSFRCNACPDKFSQKKK